MGSWVAVFRMVFRGWEGLRCGASLGPLRCSPCFRPGVQFLPGCVQFSAKCVQFPARCVHFSRRFPQMCPLGPRMCPPGPLTGDSRRPGLPGRSGSDFGGHAALGTRRASARGPGRRPTLADSPFSGSGEGAPWSSMIGTGDGPRATGGHPGVRRGLRPGPGGRTGGRGRCGGTGRCRP